MLSLTVWLEKKNRKSLKPLGSRPGIMYGLYKVNKVSVNCPSFWPILSALNIPFYNLQTCEALLLILKSLTTNKLTVKDSFYFAEEIVGE